MVPACAHILRYRPTCTHDLCLRPVAACPLPPLQRARTGSRLFFSENPFALHSDSTSHPRCREQYVVLCEVPLLMFLQCVTALRGWKNAGPDWVSVIYGSPWW